LEKVAIIHTYADGPYNRSSFHLAEQPNHVVAVVSELEKGALQQGLMATPLCDEQKDDASRRPFVVIINHVVVMLLKEEIIHPTLLRNESGMV
jgi:hypothetical protein